MKKRSFLLPALLVFVSLLFSNSSLQSQTVELTSKGELQDPPPVNASPDAGQLLHAIEKRNAELDKRSEEIEQENQRLQALKSEINSMLGKYTQQKDEAAKKAKQSDGIDEKQLEHLSKMYEAMPPKDAAARIERLKEPLALRLLSNIKPKAASKILNEIKPAKAARLTERLARITP